MTEELVEVDPNIREKLQVLLGEYILETITYIEKVRDFCERESKWTLQREIELKTMRDIKDRADQISLKNKFKAFGKYLKSGLTEKTADSRRQALEKELGEVLNETLIGLEKLKHFLDLIEKLAVTSLFVFTNQSFMPRGVSAMDVRSVISTARSVSTKLVNFKRDAGAFFLPSLSNVDVMAFQLDKYIRITQELCEKMNKKCRSVSCFGNLPQWENNKPALKFTLNTSEKSVQNLYDHLNQLNKIRMDESFRMTFIFNKDGREDAQRFIGIFSQRSSRMFQFLSNLEEAAVQLDRMKFGSNISTVAGSSVGIAGGVLSIVGLALAPVTAGVSLALTITGAGLGITSGVNSVVTGITEIFVNRHHGNNANNIFTRFMEDVEKLQDCIDRVASSENLVAGPDNVRMALKAGKMIITAGAVSKGIDSIVDAASAVKALKTEEVAMRAANMGLQEVKAARNIPNLAADLPDIGQLAKGTPLALSKSARAGFIGLNALFIGLDVLFIYKDSVSLAKGSKNEVAKLIRTRSVLWRSEVEAWRKIHDHLCKGIWKYHKNQTTLEQPFITEDII